jgi:hypothetical protein
MCPWRTRVMAGHRPREYAPEFASLWECPNSSTWSGFSGAERENLLAKPRFGDRQGEPVQALHHPGAAADERWVTTIQHLGTGAAAAR